MSQQRLFNPLIFCFCIVHILTLFSEESFLLIDGSTHATVLEIGQEIDTQISPCSTFKIALALMGYDAGILVDHTVPTWNFQEGYDDWLPSWKEPQTPKSWMQCSCVWYSKVLSVALGLDTMQSYLTIMHYGNEDSSGGLTSPGPANPLWINSSLKISVREQVDFIQHMLLRSFPVSSDAVNLTKGILFKEKLAGGWCLFGKTGWSGSEIAMDGKTPEHGWFVGWIEKEDRFFPFAYLIREQKIHLDQRILRTKQLLNESGVFELRKNG